MKTECVRPGLYTMTFQKINRINFLITKELGDNLRALNLKPAQTLIIDLSGIQFIDTAGFEFLLSAMHDANNINYTIELVNISPEVAELITLLNLEQVLMHKKKLIS